MYPYEDNIVFKNDKNSHIKSVIIFFKQNTIDSPKEVSNYLIDATDSYYQPHVSGNYAETLYQFCTHNKFFIGPDLLKNIAAFFSFLGYPSIILPDEKKIIDEVCDLAANRLYQDIVRLLNTISHFTLFNDIIHIEEERNPLNVLLKDLNFPISPISAENHASLIEAINLLVNKYFLFPIYAYRLPCSVSANENLYRTKIFTLLENCNLSPEQIKERNKEIKQLLKETSWWQTEKPCSVTHHVTPHTLKIEGFRNLGLAEDKFQAYVKYFQDIYQLFKDPWKCLEYLEPLEADLAKEVSFDPQKLQSKFWISSSFKSFPLPPKDYQSTKKNNALKKLLVKWLQGKHLKHPTNLLSSGDFWNTFGYIDKEIANQLVSDGELFWESGYVVNGNIHGNATHPLQILILILANESGSHPFPENDSIREVLDIMVSQKMIYQELPIWSTFLDNENQPGFSSPVFIQYFMMMEAESKTPTLSYYLRTSFWNHYRIVQEKSQLPLSGLLLLDLLASGLFQQKSRYSFNNLLERYEEKNVTIQSYPNVSTLFKKIKSPQADTIEELPKLSSENINSI